MFSALGLVVVALLPTGAPNHELEDRRALRRLLAVRDAPDIVRDVLPAVKDRLCRLIRRWQDLR